ncbi:MAG TPA: transcription-repair coupling factor [Acidimicrobiales bacterium]|nr:transcription-repair coupling factor [Acidimicrobiales bacterium]
MNNDAGAPLAPLPPLLRAEPAISALLGKGTAHVAVPEAARPLFVAAIASLSQRHPILVVTPTAADATHIARDLSAFLGEDAVDTFPAWETLPFERVSPNVETMGRRLRTMWHLQAPERAPRAVVAPVRAVVQRLGPHVEDVAPVVLTRGDQIDRDELVEQLVGLGYRREYQVEHRGELAVRGSIVDVFAATMDAPVRIDLWGDEIDRLTTFAVADQRSVSDLEAIELFGCREVLPTADVRARAEALVTAAPWAADQWERLADGHTFDGMESWLPWLTTTEHVLADLLPADALVLLFDPRRMRDRAGDILAEEASLAESLAKTWGVPDGPKNEAVFPRLHLPFDRLLAHTTAPVWSVTASADSPDTPAVDARVWDPVVGDPTRLVERLKQLTTDGFRITVAADGEGSAARITANLRDEGFVAPEVVIAPLERGVILPSSKLALLAEPDITGRRRAHRTARPRARATEGFFDDMAPGSYVVHHHHGVARYAGMVTRTIGGVERDYLLLEYRGDDKLYVPSDQIDTLRPYSGGETPSLSRMGGADFAKAKARVRAAVREIAQELVVLYQRRVTSSGHSFPQDSSWQREFEEGFGYIETPDQLTAIEAVKADMEAEKPMDRLLCGDVGFGKTEVALRAAFKAVQDGKQVAVLVPTTLLAQQHGQTFTQRLAGYPVRVEVLSRFLTPAQARKVVEGVRAGDVDVVIGTHRLLSGDISFKNLGLLVVDEEQRFGVQHKESIKKLKVDVDVLTLSATPIPRTLEMSLTGIRDLSILLTPPADRQPILTYVGEYDERAVSESIRRELLREGQVFYVHNRVADIEVKARDLRELVPEARIAIAHGQMDEGSLEKVVIDFVDGEFDVLVCTTIIESGIDMPQVNTLVVDRADMLGLGQLHQIRGRVGRSGVRAYAYLFFPPDRALSETAYERLRTIGEHTELGSGFKIAMRDLEIRGVGNLLGENQSGHIAAVGYDLYMRMVTEAVAELKGEPVREPAEIKLDIDADAHLPRDYVGREDLRLEAYRRLATVATPSDVEDISVEWQDRYGPPPPPAAALLTIGRLRAACAMRGIRELTVARNVARISPVDLPASKVVRMQRLHPKAVHKADIRQLVVPVPPRQDSAAFLLELLDDLIPLADASPVGSATP